MTLEDQENYLTASVHIKIVCLSEDGFGWDLWEDGNIFCRNLKISVAPILINFTVLICYK